MWPRYKTPLSRLAMRSPLGWGESGFDKTGATEANRNSWQYEFFKRTNARIDGTCSVRSSCFRKCRVRPGNQGPSQVQGPGADSSHRAQADERRAGEQGIESGCVRSGRPSATSRPGQIQSGPADILIRTADLRPPGAGRGRFWAQNAVSGGSQRPRRNY